MNNKHIWNIVIKFRKRTIKINVSVFFFLVIPFIYYLSRESSDLYLSFVKNYVVLFLIYAFYKVIINLFRKKNSYIYPFGVFTNSHSNLDRDDKLNHRIKSLQSKNTLLLVIDYIFLICASVYFYHYNYSYEVVSYPLLLLLTSIYSRTIFNDKKFNSKKRLCALLISFLFFSSVTFLELAKTNQASFSFSYLFENLFYNIEYSVIFISLFYFIFNRENLSEIENFGKEFFVKEIMTSKDFLMTLSPTDTVDKIIDDVLKLPQKVFPVLVNGKIVGIVKRDEIIINYKVAIMDDYPLIEEIMTKVYLQVSPESNLLIAKKIFEKASNSFYCIPVVKDGKFTGLLFYELFLEFVSMKKVLFKLKINE